MNDSDHLKLSQKQTLFLYAFLRQADRSLDKSRWSSVEALNTYYRNKITPEQVISYLREKFNDIPSSNLTFKDKFRILFQRNYLTLEEITQLHELLSAFDRHLKSDSAYMTKTELLRIDIARFYSKVLGSRISGRNLKKLMFTEHYEQNRLVKPFELTKVIPKDF